MPEIDLGSIAAAIADVGKPAIPEGTFLALVESVEPKFTADTGNFGLNWSLLVNLTPFAPGVAWDAEARCVPLKHYTYLGKRINGKLSDTSNAFKAAEILAALGHTNGNLDTDAVKFRQVVVRVKHEADKNNPDQLWPRANKVLKYEVNGEVAPVLAYFAEDAKSSEPVAADAPEF